MAVKFVKVAAKLSPKQRELLARAAAGEDRQLPERAHYAADRVTVTLVMPARRWFVPPGLLVTNGQGEEAAARALARRGLLKHGSVPPSAELPYGQGGYLVTKKGWASLV